jgi:hypothetical protein
LTKKSAIILLLRKKSAILVEKSGKKIPQSEFWRKKSAFFLPSDADVNEFYEEFRIVVVSPSATFTDQAVATTQIALIVLGRGFEKIRPSPPRKER